MKKIIHLLWTGGIGGIERLCLTIGECNPNIHEFWFVHSGGTICDQMKRQGLSIKQFNYENKDALRLCKALKSAESETEAVIIHHDATMLWICVPILKIKAYTVPIYLYAHCAYADFANSLVKKMVFRYSSSLCDGIIAISDSVKNSVLEHQKLEKISVIYNGIDLNKYTKNNETKDVFRIIFVGRLIEQKGVKLLIEALSIVKKQIDYECCIVGNGPEKKELEEMTKLHELQGKVLFLGNRTDVPDLLHESVIFVHPATWEEGFGITLIEAMACGLPCIAFRKGAIPEYIQDEVNGFLVSETSADALASKIIDVYHLWEQGRLKTVSKQARNTAETFSCEKTEENIRKLVLRKKGQWKKENIR